MDYLLQILDQIYTKYRILISMIYGIVLMVFLFYLFATLNTINTRYKVEDSAFLAKQIEVIKKDQQDFKEADIPVINMICDFNKDNFLMQVQCQKINNFIDLIK